VPCRDFFTNENGETFLSPNAPEGGGLVSLFEALPFSPITYLDISSNRIHLKNVSDGAWTALESRVERSQIDTIDLSHNNLAGGGDESKAGQAIELLFAASCKGVTRLITQGCGLKANHMQKLKVAAETLRESDLLSPLEYLDCSSNTVGDEGVGYISEAIQIGKLPIVAISLRDVAMTNVAAEALATSLESNFLRFLDMSRNDLSTEGIERLHSLVMNTMNIKQAALMALARIGMPPEVRAAIWVSVWPSGKSIRYPYEVHGFPGYQ